MKSQYYIDSFSDFSGLGGGVFRQASSLKGAKQIAARLYRKDIENLTILIFDRPNGLVLSERRNFPYGKWKDINYAA